MENIEPSQPITLPSQGRKFMPILIVVLVLCAVGALGYFAYTKFYLAQNPSSSSTPTPTSVASAIQWQTPTIIADQGLWQPTENPVNQPTYYQVGTVDNGMYAGGIIILASIPCEGPCFQPQYYRLIKKSDSSFVLLAKYSEQYINLIADKYTTDPTYTIPELDFPQILVGPKPHENLELDSNVREFFDASKFTKVFIDLRLGDVFTDSEVVGSRIGGAQPTRNGFYLRAADGTLRSYKLKVDFINTSNIPAITWDDGAVNNNTYQAGYVYTDIGGCGSTNYASVIPASVVNPATDLVATGHNTFGETIYELKNSNHVLLKDIYNNQYNVYQPGQQKISYADFLKQHPLFFWVDPFGRLIKFQNNNFVPQAECGKPVIYLYPIKPMDIHVTLAPQGGFTYTEPVYSNGWFVHADTQSNLTDKRTGLSYPYLFWEGRGGIYQQPAKGFIVRQPDVHEFLIKKLAILGLNSKETRDFMDFWEPRMQSAPYYFVSFLGTQAMDQIAPLTISPKPDTIIRILMDFSPLQKPTAVSAPMLRTPVRSGFTVVEWGGVIR